MAATRSRRGSRDDQLSPGWIWPVLAAPATVYLLLLFLGALFVILAVTFGKTDPILQTPLPVWNPVQWRADVLTFTASNLTHSDGLYAAALVRTIVYVTISTTACLVIGYPFAYFVARHAGRFRGLFLLAFFAPFWISYMLRMLAWISLLQEDGYINRILVGLGILEHPYPFLAGHAFVLLFGLTYGYVPYMVLPLFAALDRIPQSTLEASQDLGASPSRTFWKVTLPQSRQAILAGVIICGLPMFGDYFTQQLLANTNGTRMIGNFIVDNLGTPLFVSRGAALTLVLMALMIAPVIYYLRSTRRAAVVRSTR